VRTRITSLMGILAFDFMIASYLALGVFGWALAVGLPAVMLIGELVMPLILYRGLPTYAQKLEASVRGDIEKPTGPDVALIQGLMRFVTPSVAIFVFVAVITALFAYSVGMREARSQSEYLVLDGNPPCAVVRALSEGLLCVTFDRHTAIVRGEYTFLKPAGSSLRLRKVGPLKEVEVTTADRSPSR
jgi:hypothetical protein